MDKIKISDYCKNIRKQSGLTSEQFAKSKGVSRAYISKIEAGKSDRPSIAVLAKIARVYDLSADNLLDLDVDDIFVEGAGLLTHGKNPFKDNRSRVKQLEDFDLRYLIPNGYKTEFIYGKKLLLNDYVCDISGIGPNNEKFFGCIIDGFSTSTTTKNRKKKLTASVFAFIESVLNNTQLDYNQKLSLFLITNSDSVIQMFEDFHERIALTSSDANYNITAIYIFKNRPMVMVRLL